MWGLLALSKVDAALSQPEVYRKWARATYGESDSTLAAFQQPGRIKELALESSSLIDYGVE